jgi:hypothetical protein
MARFAERLDQVGRRFAIVFDDKDSHGGAIVGFGGIRQIGLNNRAGRLRDPPADDRTTVGATNASSGFSL